MHFFLNCGASSFVAPLSTCRVQLLFASPHASTDNVPSSPRWLPGHRVDTLGFMSPDALMQLYLLTSLQALDFNVLTSVVNPQT